MRKALNPRFAKLNDWRNRAALNERQFTGPCPIREHDGDGRYCGRCDFATYDGVCEERHGVVADYPTGDDREVDPRDRRFAPVSVSERSDDAR